MQIFKRDKTPAQKWKVRCLLSAGRGAAALTGIVLLTVFLASCNAPGLLNISRPSSGGAIVFLVNASAARILTPNLDTSIASYTYAGTGPGGATFSSTAATAAYTASNLPQGSWSVSVNGLNAAGTVIGTGAASVSVVTGQTATVNITVGPVAGNGTLTVNLSWPTALVAAPQVTASLTSAAGIVTLLPFSAPSSGTSTYTGSVANGYYTLSIQLLDNGQLVAGSVEIARIIAGQTTTGTYNYTNINDPGSIIVNITPAIANPIPVTVAGAVAAVATKTPVNLSASVPAGNTVTYVWFVNGTAVGTGATVAINTVAAPLFAGSYRVDCLAFSTSGQNAGDSTFVLTVTPAAAPPTLTLQQPDGGPHYYAQFANGLPDDPSFFPVAVWYQNVLSQSDIDLDKGAGLNTYVVLGADTVPYLTLLSSNGMNAIPQSSMPVGSGTWLDHGNDAGSASIKGWYLLDEEDTVPETTGIPLIQSLMAGLPGDGRFNMIGYTNGLLFRPTYMNIPGLNVNQEDVYWFSWPNLQLQYQGAQDILGYNRDITAAEAQLPYNYGRSMMWARNLVSPLSSRPLWAVIDVAWAGTQGGHMPPTSIEPSVWHSIIGGARGINYYPQCFDNAAPKITDNSLRETSIPQYVAARNAVTTVNGKIRDLAPVLNAPFVTNTVTCSTVAFMVKWYNGSMYIFAGNKTNNPVTAIFNLAGVNAASATVLYESRSIPVVGGSFQDVFADMNSVHIYKVGM